jgi:hypothetical protein
MTFYKNRFQTLVRGGVSGILELTKESRLGRNDGSKDELWKQHSDKAIIFDERWEGPLLRTCGQYVRSNPSAQ